MKLNGDCPTTDPMPQAVTGARLYNENESENEHDSKLLCYRNHYDNSLN